MRRRFSSDLPVVRVRCGDPLRDSDSKRQERILIGGKDYGLDLTEAGSNPLAGLSLTAISKLTCGLAHLPEVAAKAPSGLAFNLMEKDAISIDLDFDEGLDFRAAQTLALSAARTLRPLPMAPITGGR